jgi:tyrosine-protein phosphatase YwqE
MNSRTKRILSLVLTLCMLLSTFPVTALGLDTIPAQAQSQSTEVSKGSDIPGTGYHVTSMKNYAIAPDISERVIITNNDAGTSQTVANVMEVNTAGGRAKIVAGYGNRNPKEQGWTLKTTTDQAHVYEKETGLNVVGGVNASWFNINTGEPSGYLVMNGVVHHDNSSRAFIAAFDDGSVNVFREGTTLAQAEADQSAKQGKTVKILEAVDALVAMVWDGKVVVTESGNSGYYPRTCVGIKADGTVVLFQADGTMAPRSVGYTAAEEAQMMVALGCVAAIQLDEGGSSTYISQREGEQDVTMRNTPAGGSERVVSGTILVVSTVAASGEFDHAAVTPDDEYYTPGSSVTLTAEAMDFSGAAAKVLPEDAVFTVSDASMGTVTATDLSGSSASAVFTSSGKTGDVTVNLVSGGQTVGSAVLHVQNPDRLAFASDEVNLNYKDVSDLGFKATYQTEAVHLQDNDIQWSISDPDAGSFSGNRFTVTDNVKYSGSPTVTAVRGDLTASVTVNIGMEPTMIIDGGDEDPWDYSTIGTTVESFSGLAANAVATYHYAGRGGVVKGSVVSDTDEAYADIVRFGHNAVKLEYDWTNINGTDGACLGLGDNLAIDGTPTALGVWVYIPEGVPVPWLRAQIATSTDGGSSWTNAYINFSSGSGASGEGLKSGWQYLEADLTSYAGAKIRVNSGMLFRAMVTTGGIGWYTTDGVKLDKSELKGYILLDNLCVVYGANNQDVTAPVVSSIQLVNDDGTKTELEDGAVLNSGNLRFFVTYDDSEESDPYATGVESAYFYFDGTYRGTYDRDNLGSTSGLMHFGNGLHSITFYLKDGYGNVTRETRYFTVNAEQTDVPGVSLELQGQPTVGKTWELALSSSDPASITSLSANVSVSRSYPVTGVTFPEGVTGTWSYDAGVVSVSITAVDHQVFTAGALAVIAVDIPTSVAEGGSVNVQVTKGSYGCKQTENLDISDLNQYATGFTTPVTNRPIEAMYRIQADTAVVGSAAAASVTVIRDGKAAAGVSVYADDVLLGVTDENGRIDISSLTAAQGSVNLRAADAEGNCSYQITLYSYDAVGDETGAPYYVIYNLSQSADGKTVTWMSNPVHSAARAVARISASADMTGAAEVEGESRLISYSSSKQINRVNAVSLTGLEAGATYYYQVGDGSVWSEVRSFTVPAAEKQTRFFLLADIQEEAALEGMGRIANHLAGQYPFGVQLGDAVDNVRYYNQWEDALSLFTLDGIRDTDMIHVVGNHEADDGGNNAIAAKSVFGVPAAWYSVERGDVYIAVLNHTSDKDTLQQFTQWLVEDAAKTTCTWKVLVTHVPAYYTNPTGGGETYVQYLPAACDAAGIDFYFSGNDHSYARTAPMTGGQVDENGTVYYICGSTGGKSYSIVNNPDFHFDVATLDFDSVYVDVTADRFQATVTAYNVATDGTRTVLDQFTRRTAPICQNDEHTYVYDRSTGQLECSVCGHTENAAQVQYNGWATDSESGRRMYFTAGRYVTGYLFLDEVNYNFDADGLAYTGEYIMDGQRCTFLDGQFVPTENILLAGICGENACFVLYRDGRMVITGSGPLSTTSRATVPWQTAKDGIRKVYVSAGITTLSTQCFYYCSMMTDLIFESGSQLTTISGSAFNGCSRLVRINLEECTKLNLISGSAFYDCRSLTSIVLPEGLQTINGRAFARCTSLNSVYLPDGISFISSTAFQGCGGVVLSVAYNSYAKQYAIRNGIAYVERAATVIASGSCGADASWELYGDGVLNIKGSGALTSPKAASGIAWYTYRHMIRAVHVDAGITNLPDFAFYGCSALETVSFAEGSQLTTIGGSALRGCSALTEVTLPRHVQTIYGNAFRNCSNLTSVYLPDSVSYLAASTFQGCGQVVLSVGYNSYAKDFAARNGIRYVERQPEIIASGSCGADATWELYSDGVLHIKGSGALSNPKVSSATAWYAYRHMIRVVHVDAGITNLPDFAFFGCSALETVSFAEGSQLTTIGGSAFNGCTSLKELTLPQGVKTIYGNAFRGCSSLVSVYLPDTVSYITGGAFRDCGKVVLSVAYNSYAKQYAIRNGIAYVERERAVTASGSCGADATWELYSDGALSIRGTGSLTNPAYAGAVAWSAYRESIRTVEVASGITNLPDFAFYGCSALETVSFAEGSQLTTIGGSAFNGCTSLKELTLPQGVKTIYGNAFRSCSSLTSVYLPDTVSYITGGAFRGCGKVVLSVAYNSYAKQYAIRNGIAYVERWNHSPHHPQLNVNNGKESTEVSMDSFPGLPQREAEKETGEPVTFADIHTHLLSGVDDGAKDEDEMLAILDAAYQSGTRLLCCTPHFHPGYWGHNRERSAAAYDRLTAAVRDRYPDLRLHLGNELRYSPECVSWLREGDCRTLGQTRCVLVDFSSDAPARLIESGLGSLINAGYTPVLAHAERYEALHGKLAPLRDFRRNGVLLQADTQSLFRGFGFAVRRQCRKLLAEGLIDLFSSDAHDCAARPPEMDACFDYITKKYGRACAESLCRDTAQQLLCGSAAGKDFF